MSLSSSIFHSYSTLPFLKEKKKQLSIPKTRVEILVLYGVGLLLKCNRCIFVCWLFLIAEYSIVVVLCWQLHVATRTTHLSFQMSCRSCNKHIGVSTGTLFLLTTGLVSYIFYIIWSVLHEGVLCPLTPVV